MHIFNPSSFPLAVFSLALLAAGKEAGSAWGHGYRHHAVLSAANVPDAISGSGCRGRFFFGVTSMTMSAVVTTWAFGADFISAMTGIYFFLRLVYSDCSVFGNAFVVHRSLHVAAYGTGADHVRHAVRAERRWGCTNLLGSAGVPTFYDKLLQVPVLNLSIKGIDGLALDRGSYGRLDPVALGRSLTARTRNVAYMSVWGMVFAGLSVAQGVGDNHPGQWLPFWRQACGDGRAYACPYLADMEELFCKQGSGWACNEAGRMNVALARTGEDLRRQNPAEAAVPLGRGCELGFETACRNLDAQAGRGGELASAEPGIGDLPIILRGSKGEIRAKRNPEKLYGLGQGGVGRWGMCDLAAQQTRMNANNYLLSYGC